MSDRKKFIYLVIAFVVAYFIPMSNPRVKGAVLEAFFMLQEYAREHVLFCLVPAFFIAGGIAVFVSQASVIKYFGADARKVVSYGVASVSGSVLAVCSCTVLPLFAGIYQRGAGIGPATAFLYSGPAINVLAIILTARVLGLRMGIARAVGAVVFAVVIGLLMAAIYRRDEAERAAAPSPEMMDIEPVRKLWQDLIYFALLAVVLWRWFERDELKDWVGESYNYALMILPLLFAGVLAAGFLLGRPGHEALIPAGYVEAVVGSSPDRFIALAGIGDGAGRDVVEALWPLWTCFFASVSGALMYFATLTEIPILEGLMGAGMGEGPALSLLLAGPAVSLPNLLVIRGVLGTGKTITYVVLVVVMATASGVLYEIIF